VPVGAHLHHPHVHVYVDVHVHVDVDVDVDGFLGADLNYRRWLALPNSSAKPPHTRRRSTLSSKREVDELVSLQSMVFAFDKMFSVLLSMVSATESSFFTIETSFSMANRTLRGLNTMIFDVQTAVFDVWSIVFDVETMVFAFESIFSNAKIMVIVAKSRCRRRRPLSLRQKTCLG
jgi:hypothetical protein